MEDIHTTITNKVGYRLTRGTNLLSKSERLDRYDEISGQNTNEIACLNSTTPLKPWVEEELKKWGIK